MARIRRTKQEQLEDAFADLSLIEQEKMLERLQSMNRWCIRERDRSPKTGDEAEDAGRSAHADAVMRPNGGLPEEHEQ